jgi:hypothetical protein
VDPNPKKKFSDPQHYELEPEFLQDGAGARAGQKWTGKNDSYD